MNYAGIDYHKRYSVVNIIDDHGELHVDNARVAPNSVEGFRAVFTRVSGPITATFECGLNWGWLYDTLEETGLVERIVVANPGKVKVIAAAEIKTDKIDALKLAGLLQARLIPAVHVPDRKTRGRKDIVRQRAQWVRMRTRIRNRIHVIIDRQRDLHLAQVTDIFGRKGLSALQRAILSEPDATLLRQNLAAHETLVALIREDERLMAADNNDDAVVTLLLSLPGVGPIIASVIALEIDGIERFTDADRLCSYAGVVPSTYSSGGHTRHGHMLVCANHWLKWALIEAAWVAVGCDPYFGGLYRRQRARGKKATTAITIVARRMCRIIWCLLKEQRCYQHYEQIKLPVASCQFLTKACA